MHATYPNDDHWEVSAELIYALPNEGSFAGLKNEPDVRDKVVLFNRSLDVSIVEQVSQAQHAGAIAIIIVDFHDSNEKRSALQAALTANPDMWKALSIPSVIVSHNYHEKLLQSMDVVRGDVGGYKDQFVMANTEYAAWVVMNDEL